MASGNSKLSPRQRMINMMYLVLTAMLALQVSSSLLDKFIFLNDSLEHSLDNSIYASEQALIALKKKVVDEGSSPGGIATIRKAEALKKETAEIIGYIDKLKKNLIDNAGAGLDPKTGAVKHPDEETKVEVYMIGGKNKKVGKAYELKNKLDDYVDYLYANFRELGLKDADKTAQGEFSYLTSGNKDKAIYASDPIQRNKDFAAANFGQTPVVAALAVLTQKQNEIVRYEQEILKRLGIRDIAWLPKFDSIVALASADTRTVASGAEYTARMFLSASTSRSDIKMYVNGQEVRVQDGLGVVKIPTSGAGEREWEGKIKLKIKGRDTTFTFREKFTVVEPVLLVNNRNKFPLYQNCANILETAVPALGTNYDPVFSTNNGRTVVGSRIGDVTIVPNKIGDCKLTVSSGGRRIGVQEFTVNPVPRPTIYLGPADKNLPPYPHTEGIPNIRKIYVHPKPDETFARTLPNEAKYRIVQVKVTHFKDGSARGSQVFNNGMIDLQSFNPTPKRSAFQIQVLQMQRMNSFGVPETVRPLNSYISFFSK